jgi:hypothetical protein
MDRILKASRKQRMYWSGALFFPSNQWEVSLAIVILRGPVILCSFVQKINTEKIRVEVDPPSLL